MLNLAFIFDDANRGLTGHATRLAVFPLPATVYLMQRDVINHYNYALDHYFTLTLQESFLQGSSIGPPYEKWAYFTNEDFGLLSFAIHNLLRYTSRLIHETECATLVDEARYSEMKSRSNTYTHLLCEIKYRRKAIGITVEDNNRLGITAAWIEPSTTQLRARGSQGQRTKYFRVIRDSRGDEHEEPIEKEEYDRLSPQIRPAIIDISDRSVLTELRQQGKREVAELITRNEAFAEACRTYYRSRDVVGPFSNLNESYWV
jgi:hypothetical protein